MPIFSSLVNYESENSFAGFYVYAAVVVAAVQWWREACLEIRATEES
jgi:hypothetical protein